MHWRLNVSRDASPPRRGRGAAWLVAGLLIVGFLGADPAQGQRPRKRLPPPPADLPGHVLYLARQLFGVPLDESDPITSQIQKLVLDDVEDWLGHHAAETGADGVPFDVKIRRELETAFSRLHYPLFGQPAVFVEKWKDSSLAGVGYTLGWNDYDRVNVVALFELRGGTSRRAAVTSFVPRTDLHYEFLRGQQDDFRFFIYGTRLGKSQPRLSATLFAFDGNSLKSQWETRDAYDGRLEFGKGRVVLRYLKEDEYIREQVYKRKPPRHESTYKITPQGLELEGEREIPF